MVFDYILRRRLRGAVGVEGNSAWDHRVALAPTESCGDRILREFLAPKSILNHICIEQGAMFVNPAPNVRKLEATLAIRQATLFIFWNSAPGLHDPLPSLEVGHRHTGSL